MVLYYIAKVCPIIAQYAFKVLPIGRTKTPK